MLIATTQEESDTYVEQEITHCIRLNKKPDLLVEDGVTFLVDNERGCLCVLPKPVVQVSMKTKKYGVLVVFDCIRDLLDSRFNKGILAVYCNNVTMRKTKRTINKVCSFTTFTEDIEFEDKEFGGGNGLYMNATEKIEKHEGFLLVVERNRFAQNGCNIIDSHKLKREDDLFINN